MAHLSQQLPSDVWLYVFTYLSTVDKFSIRACCKYFNQLVDHGSLWKDYTVVLSFKHGMYNPQFWASLSRRRIRSAVVQCAKAKHWRQLASSLPSLSTIAVHNEIQESIHHLSRFPKLKRLVMRSTSSTVVSDVIVVQPQQMTDIRLCGVGFLRDSFIAFISEFKNLTSLVYHTVGNTRNQQMFHIVITGLPKLKHLSWTMNRQHSIVPGKFLGETGVEPNHRTLTSLELVFYDDFCLSNETMCLLTCLQSLTVTYMEPLNECLLKTWLRQLHQLSTLVIVRAPPPCQYVHSIPVTVTSLAICAAPLRLADMGAIATQLPDLVHLHLDPWPKRLRIGQIATLFPKLHRIKLRIADLREKDLLHFHRLRSLKSVEVMDVSSPRLFELSRQLQTSNIRLLTPVCGKDPLACYHQFC